MVVRPPSLVAIFTYEEEPESNRCESFAETLQPELGVSWRERGEKSGAAVQRAVHHRQMFVIVCERGERVVFVLMSFEHETVGPGALVSSAAGAALPTWKCDPAIDVRVFADQAITSDCRYAEGEGWSDGGGECRGV